MSGASSRNRKRSHPFLTLTRSVLGAIGPLPIHYPLFQWAAWSKNTSDPGICLSSPQPQQKKVSNPRRHPQNNLIQTRLE